VLASFLNLARDDEQRLQPVGDFRGGIVPQDAIDEVVVTAQVFGSCRTAGELAETAMILGRTVGRDHFTFPGVGAWGPSNRTSSNSRSTLVLSEPIAMGPRIPRSPSGS
jgi:hypothetical protein